MKSLNLLIISTIFICASCADTAEKSDAQLNQLSNASYETNGHDTVNVIDQNGLKQGVWRPSPSNNLKDTVIYRNDTIIK